MVITIGNFGDGDMAAASKMVWIGRGFLGLALLALLAAWMTEMSGQSVLGLTQEHLFDDATVLALLGVGSFLDAFWHARRV